jgi:hypothetical protein
MRPTIRTTAAAIAVSTCVGGVVAAAPSNATSANKTPTNLTLSQVYVLPTVETEALPAGVGSAVFRPPSWARYYSVAVTDASGFPTAGDVQVLPTGTGADFCGRTTNPVPIDPTSAAKMWVLLRQGRCTDGTLAAGTTGTISVTFTS